MSNMKEALVVVGEQHRMIGKLVKMLKYYCDPDCDAWEGSPCEVADLLRKARKVRRKGKDIIERGKELGI